MLSTWVGIWHEVGAAQKVNPVLRAVAEAATIDPEQSIRNIVPMLALLHPQVVANVTATCQLAVDELWRAAGAGTDIRVVGVRYNPEVENDTGTGGDQQHDRVAELEAENASLRDTVAYLRRTLVVAQDALRSGLAAADGQEGDDLRRAAS